eukprot:3469745-Rhodomonas_salina.1
MSGAKHAFSPGSDITCVRTDDPVSKNWDGDTCVRRSARAVVRTELLWTTPPHAFSVPNIAYSGRNWHLSLAVHTSNRP